MSSPRGLMWSSLLLCTVALSAMIAAPACAKTGSGTDPETFSDLGDAAPGDSGGPLSGLDSLTVSPASANLVSGDGPTSAAFTAQGKFKDGTTRDVTSLVTWEAAPSALLVATGATVAPAAALGGDGTMTAHAGAASAGAPVHVKLVKIALANGASADAPAKFQGATEDPTLAPSVAYPLDGALFPPNLAVPDVQFAPAAGTALFEVAFSGPSLDVHIYTPCKKIGATAGCSLVPDGPIWSAIVATIRGGDAITLSVRALGATPGKVGTVSMKIQVAGTEVAGGLYYFNTKPQPLADGGTTPPGIYRYDFEKAAHEPFFTRDNCAGCHALSKDGTKLLAPICTLARGCGRPLQLAVVDVATKQVVTPPFPVGDTDTQTWSPDNKYYVTTPACGAIDPNPPNGCTGYSGGVLNLIDATTNTLVNKVPTGASAMYPSFSNDGKRLVYAAGGKYNAPLSIEQSSIWSIDFTPPSWGTEKLLLQSTGENNFHPSFSPDDAWIIFTRSACAPNEPPSSCDSYDDPGARVMFMPSAGGGATALDKANGKGNLDNSWPKWSPFKGSYKGGDLFWLTFSSARDYGYRTYDQAGQPTHYRQLWLVAFDVARAKAGQDPSFAPVWLPFQDTATSNHIGQWTEKVIGGPK